MNKKGQIYLWELALVGALALGWFIYTDAHKQTQVNTFQPDSKQVTTADKKYAVVNDINIFSGIHFGGGSKSSPKSAATAPSTITQPVEAVVVTPAPQVVEQPKSFGEMLGIPKAQAATFGHLTPFERFGFDFAIIFIVMLFSGLLDALGGKHWLFCRRFIMPSLIGAGISAIVYSFYPVWYAWLTIFAVLPMMGTLTLGYPDNGDNFGRALWLFIQAATAGVFLLAISYFFHCHLIAWWLYIAYTAICGIWGGIYKNWHQFFGDWVTGSLGLATIILWVYLSLQFGL